MNNISIPQILLLALVSLFASCANVPQIDRGNLALDIMQLSPFEEEESFSQEVRSFREGAIGGSESVGGGCGCN